MLHCAGFSHARSPCCCGYRDVRCLLSATPAMSEHSRVSAHIDNTATTASAAQEGALSRAAALVCCAAWPCLAMGCDCSSSAPSAAHGRLRTTDTAASATIATISNSGTPPLHSHPVRQLLLLLCLHRCSIVRRAASTNSRSSSAQPSSRSTRLATRGAR